MPRPLAVKRHQRIVDQVMVAGSVSIADLADEFAVSRETIRRDLKALERRGYVAIVHGGASRPAAAEPFAPRGDLGNRDGKAAIGRAAARMVSEGMVVLLDCGSTAFAVAEALTEKKSLTVITVGLANARLLARAPGIKVIQLGGEIDPSAEAVVGVDTMAMLPNWNVDIAFIGSRGVAADGQPTDLSRLWAEQRRLMAAAAKRAYFLLDSTKFGRATPVRISFREATGVIVDSEPSTPLAAALSDRGLDLVVG